MQVHNTRNSKIRKCYAGHKCPECCLVEPKIFKINIEQLRKTKERGHCLCEVKKLQDDSNVCPCEEFLTTQNCKCGVYSNR